MAIDIRSYKAALVKRKEEVYAKYKRYIGKSLDKDSAIKLGYGNGYTDGLEYALNLMEETEDSFEIKIEPFGTDISDLVENH